MSYLEYTVKTVPSGFRKVLFLNWPLVILLTAVASFGFLMLYSVAGGSFDPWAAAQIKRFLVGMAVMLLVAMIPIWFWRNVSPLAYLISLVLLVVVEVFGTIGMGAQRWIDLGFMRLPRTKRSTPNVEIVGIAWSAWIEWPAATATT